VFALAVEAVVVAIDVAGCHVELASALSKAVSERLAKIGSAAKN
jgi:hypothetical protein